MLAVLLSLVALVGFFSFPLVTLADDGEQEEAPEITQLDGVVPPATKPRYPRLDTQLNRMVEQAGRESSQATASGASLYHDVLVVATIRLSGNVSTTAGFLDKSGPKVASAGTDYIEAYVPVTVLAALSEREGVLRVETIIPPHPLVTSQGTTIHGSTIWNSRGFTGAGVKVGVIDVGFIGFGGLMGVELPSTVVARCYTSLGTFTSNLADCETGDVHGTAVAEAVMDIAPGVSLYISNPASFGDLQSAASWMVSEGVAVINHSVGWIWDGPGDGTSPFGDSPLNTVDLAVAGGTIWVNAAGNSALSSWFGAYSDADSDGFLEFTSTVEVNSVELAAGETLRAQARWDDSWGNAARDFDLAARPRNTVGECLGV